MMIGPRPEAVAEAEAKITVAEGAVAFSKAHLDFHTIRSPIDGVARQPDLPSRPDDRDRDADRRGRRYPQVLVSVYLPPRSARAGSRRPEGPGQERRFAAGIGPPRSRRRGRTGLEGKVDFVGRIADPRPGTFRS